MPNQEFLLSEARGEAGAGICAWITLFGKKGIAF